MKGLPIRSILMMLLENFNGPVCLIDEMVAA